jgi:hypothetical protein
LLAVKRIGYQNKSTPGVIVIFEDLHSSELGKLCIQQQVWLLIYLPLTLTCIQSSICYASEYWTYQILPSLYIEFSSNILGIEIYGSWHALSLRSSHEEVYNLLRLTIGVFFNTVPSYLAGGILRL